MQKRLRISDKGGSKIYHDYFRQSGLEMNKDYWITLGFNSRHLTYDHYVLRFEDDEDLVAFTLAFDNSIYYNED